MVIHMIFYILYGGLSILMILISIIFLRKCWTYEQHLLSEYNEDLYESYTPLFRQAESSELNSEIILENEK